LGEFWLASDAVIPTFRKEVRIARIIEQTPDEIDSIGGQFDAGL
jgi:hypothetical protein